MHNNILMVISWDAQCSTMHLPIQQYAKRLKTSTRRLACFGIPRKTSSRESYILQNNSHSHALQMPWACEQYSHCPCHGWHHEDRRNWDYPHSTGFQIWPLLMLFLNSLWNNIFWKNICKDFCSCKSQRNAKFDILHRQKWVPDVSPLQNVKFCVPLTFTAAKVFVNIFSRKYYFTNCLEITLAGAKFWTLCCARLYGNMILPCPIIVCSEALWMPSQLYRHWLWRCVSLWFVYYQYSFMFLIHRFRLQGNVLSTLNNSRLTARSRPP